ncbi:hypothetical protein AOQ84DRAFT_436422 [Glonium stellatum]|uniref:Uncharacterized protein n=1 Tax=Glonium stellatum TaxID=574774 RepID=A0A8E2FAE9_9PEZI|nr:hypothetical protein AOQ84DRAFT_436422 [Glonium stellatum]
MRKTRELPFQTPTTPKSHHRQPQPEPPPNHHVEWTPFCCYNPCIYAGTPAAQRHPQNAQRNRKSHMQYIHVPYHSIETTTEALPIDPENEAVSPPIRRRIPSTTNPLTAPAVPDIQSHRSWNFSYLTRDTRQSSSIPHRSSSAKSHHPSLQCACDSPETVQSANTTASNNDNNSDEQPHSSHESTQLTHSLTKSSYTTSSFSSTCSSRRRGSLNRFSEHTSSASDLTLLSDCPFEHAQTAE